MKHLMITHDNDDDSSDDDCCKGWYTKEEELQHKLGVLTLYTFQSHRARVILNPPADEGLHCLM